MELESDMENLKSQLNFEQSRFKELEQVLDKERRGSHSNIKRVEDFEKANHDLKQEVDRQKLRVESKCSDDFL